MSTTTTSPATSAERGTAREAGLRVSGIQPYEFLFPGSTVTVETTAPLDPDAAKKTIGVPRANNVVKVGPKGRKATWQPPEDLEPGRHVLQIGPLLSAEGTEIAAQVAIPFQFARSAGRVPEGIAVEGMTRIRMSGNAIEALPLSAPARGKFVELLKGVDRRTQAPVSLAFNEAGKRVDEQRLFDAFEKRQAKRLGKLHPHLQERLSAGGGDKPLQIAVWAQGAEMPEQGDKRGLEQVDREPRPPEHVERRAEAMRARARKVAGLVKELGARELRVDDAAPVVFARLPGAEIRKLAERKEVAAVFLYEPEGIEDLNNSIAVANTDDVHTAGAKGAGVKVAVWEGGPASTTNLVIEDRYTASPSTSNHSQHVHGIIKNKEANKPKGHAPDCLLHSANSFDLDALRWAVKDKGCTVINQSFHRSAEPGSGALSFDDIYKDWLALNWPYPTICQAAGNYWSGDPDGISPPSSEFVNHKGFNSIAIGNHDDSAGGMSSDSVFRNPNSSHGDRELPEIAANGTSVTTVGLTMSGTSMASPAAVGVTADLQSTDGTLKSWPEGCRAILLAGATKNVTGEDWWKDVTDDDDASDGAGAVNAHESYQIVRNRRSRNAPGTRRGWDVGTLDSGDFDGNGLSTFSYKIQVPRFFFGPRRVKVALAWDSKVAELSIFGNRVPLSSQLTVDLDLKVFDASGALVGYSGSWDNSYEVVEFDARPGAAYDIRIRRWSGADWTWYGLAWTVTGSILVLETALTGGPSRISRLAEALPQYAENGN